MDTIWLDIAVFLFLLLVGHITLGQFGAAIVHGWRLPKRGINGWTGEPREKYLALVRGGDIARVESAPRIIRTQRLVLRPPTEHDVRAIFEYASDPEVTEFMVWPRLTREDEVREFLARRERDWASGSEYMWAITEPGVDVVIGGISGRPRTSDADFGYVFDRRYWNRGLATEAAAAVTSWLFSRPGVRRVWATCDVENARSIRVLEKLGLAREGLVPGGVVRPNLSSQPRDTYLYGRGA